MKYLSVLLIAVILILAGIILMLINFPGSVILLLAGLLAFILYAALRYKDQKSQIMKNMLITSSAIFLVSILVAMIRFEYFAEILMGSVLTGVVVFLILLVSGGNKKKPKEN